MTSRMATLILMLSLAACGDEHASDDVRGGNADDDHGAHAAKHGGDLLTLAEHELFLEVVHDDDAAAVHVWLYRGEEMAAAAPDAPPVLNLVAGGATKQLDGVEGDDGRWTFSDAALAGEPEGARFTISVDGQRYVPAWEHGHE